MHLVEQYTAGTRQRIAPKVARKSDEIMQQRTRVRRTAMLQMQPHILRRAAVRPQEPAAQRGKLLSVPAKGGKCPLAAEQTAVVGGKRFRCVHRQREVPPQNLIQPVRPHRLGNAVVHTGVQCPLANTSHRISGQRQQRHGAIGFQPPQTFCQLIAIHIRHADVQQHQIVHALLRQPQGVSRACRRVHLQAEAAQQLTLHHEVDLAVVHEQHRLFLIHLG